jgi:hypothetical protein
MVLKSLPFFALLLSVHLQSSAQYDPAYVSTSTSTINGEKYSVINMSRKDNRIKVKYFAAKDYNGTTVYQRYQEWARNKNIVAYTSGTYMTECDATIARPVGLCIDNGVLVNNAIKDNLDGLAIVYATGGMAVSNLKDGDLSITNADGTRENLNLRNAFQRTRFINWAKDNEATVFQTHLFYYKNNVEVFYNASPELRERRFLAVGKDSDGTIRHFLVNLSGFNTIYNATIKVSNYLKSDEDIEDLIFLINLDTGCQDVFQLKTKVGGVDNRSGFSGKASLSESTNLIVYYSE